MNAEFNDESAYPETVAGQDDSPWPEIVSRIRAGDPSGLQDLYEVCAAGIRFHLCRQLGNADLEDKVHDVFVAVTQSIRSGDLREPGRLMGYVRTILRRQVASHIETAVRVRHRQAAIDPGLTLSDHRPDPERNAIENQKMDLAMRVLRAISRRDREVLIRFYLKEESPEHICRSMDLTETQFRLIKSRAKARFGELARKRLAHRAGYRD